MTGRTCRNKMQNNDNKKNTPLGNAGKQIGNALNDGLKTGDFSGLNSAITNSVNIAIDEATNKINDAITQAQNSAKDGRANPYSSTYRYSANGDLKSKDEMRQKRNTAKAVAKNELALPSQFKAVGKAESTLMTVGGGIGLGLSTLKFIPALAGFLFSGASIGTIIPSAVIMVVSAIALKVGVNNKRFLDRAKRFRVICGTQMYAGVSQIAKSMGMEDKKVIKDVKKMIAKGIFPQGYLDDQETTLMLSDSVHEQYLNAKRNADMQLREKKAEEERLKAQSEKNRLDEEQNKELADMIRTGKAAIKELHALNDDIPGEAISLKLDKLEGLLEEIFARVSEHPEQMERMHKLMDYYLPTMLKLVNAYAEYDKVSQPGPEIISAKQEIENTLDTINQAFVQLLNNLFQSSVWDVTSDAKVLKTMLAQEGLADDEYMTNSKVKKGGIIDVDPDELKPLETLNKTN